MFGRSRPLWWDARRRGRRSVEASVEAEREATPEGSVGAAKSDAAGRRPTPPAAGFDRVFFFRATFRGLDRVGSGWTGLDRVETGSNRVSVGWTGLKRVRKDENGSNWIGIGWNGFKWVRSGFHWMWLGLIGFLWIFIEFYMGLLIMKGFTGLDWVFTSFFLWGGGGAAWLFKSDAGRRPRDAVVDEETRGVRFRTGALALVDFVFFSLCVCVFCAAKQKAFHFASSNRFQRGSAAVCCCGGVATPMNQHGARKISLSFSLSLSLSLSLFDGDCC